MGKGLNNTPELGHAHTYVNANHLLVLSVGRTECEAHRTDYDCDRKLTRDELYTSPRCPFASLPDMNGVFPPFACIERKWTGGEWWLCLHVKVTLGNSLARQKLAWLFSKRSHWPQDIWVKMDSIRISLLQTLYANSTLCKCVVFVYSKRGGFKCLCPLEPLFSLWIALSQLAQLYSCAIVVRVAWVSWSTLTLWAVLENLWKPRREVIS